MRMTKDAFTFPYTFQYVGKAPVIYELKNIFLYGQGPFIASLSFLGVVLALFTFIRERHEKRGQMGILLLIFFFVYLTVVGSFAIGFMRYMLPLYPLLCLFGAYFTNKLISFLSLKTTRFLFLFYILYFILIVAWPLSFLSIYTREHTRIKASKWINQFIPAGSSIAVEHWDDALPLSGIEKFNVLTYPLYEADTKEKWEIMESYLAKTDYIIISSNRLYVPLQKLTNCQKLPVGRCYTRTASYYKSLFDGSLGFKKVAEFTAYPKLKIGNVEIEINDDKADESFTVYDHPKVMIFKKT
jgi:hypothetical protein